MNFIKLWGPKGKLGFLLQKNVNNSKDEKFHIIY